MERLRAQQALEVAGDVVQNYIEAKRKRPSLLQQFVQHRQFFVTLTSILPKLDENEAAQVQAIANNHHMMSTILATELAAIDPCFKDAMVMGKDSEGFKEKWPLPWWEEVPSE